MNALRRINGQHHHFGHFQRLDGGRDRHFLQILLNPGLFAQTGRIDQLDGQAVLIRDAYGNRVARQAGFWAGDHPVFAQHAVEQGGFAGIRAADNGQLERVVLARVGIGGRRQTLGDFQHQIGQTVAMLSRHRHRIAQTERIGFKGGIRAGTALGLVDDQHDRRALTTQPCGEMLVGWRDAGSGIDNEQHQIALSYRRLR